MVGEEGAEEVGEVEALVGVRSKKLMPKPNKGVCQYRVTHYVLQNVTSQGEVLHNVMCHPVDGRNDK